MVWGKSAFSKLLLFMDLFNQNQEFHMWACETPWCHWANILFLFITKYFEGERYCCALAYCILSELHVVQLFKNRREIHDNREKISQRKVTAVLSSQIWFRLFYRGVKGRLSFLLKSASLNTHAWVKFDP